MAEEGVAERHLRACARFGDAVASANGRWDRPSPCTDWDARGVVEHVIGFHDVLLLRPLQAKPERPRDDPERRWTLTLDALRTALMRPGLFDQVVSVPALGNNPPSEIDARRLVPMLTLDVTVHTWDLARAVGANDHLDPELCAQFYERLPAGDSPVAPGMYQAPVDIDAEADVQSRLLARLGRDPNWRPPGSSSTRS